MTDAQLAAILSFLGLALGTIGKIAHSLFKLWRESRAETTAALVKAQDATTKALLDNTAVTVRFSEQLAVVTTWVSQHVTLPPPNKRAETLGRGGRAATPGRGVKVRGGSQTDEEE